MELVLRAAISGLIVAVASDVARRSTLLGAVIVSLPDGRSVRRVGTERPSARYRQLSAYATMR